MNTSIPSSGPRPSDRFIPWIFVGMFVLLTIVLGSFVYIAQKSYPGVVTQDAYKKGLAFNRALAAQTAQEQSGWQAEVKVEKASRAAPAKLRISLKDKAGSALAGASVQALFFRPTLAKHDVAVEAKETGAGIYEAEAALPFPGLWELRATARKDGLSFTTVERLNLP